MLYLLLIAILLTIILTLVYNKLFFNEKKFSNIEMFKNVGISGISLTEINLLFGIIAFKNELNEEKNAICYSYKDKIKKGSRILITDYDFEKEMYIVDEYPNI